MGVPLVEETPDEVEYINRPHWWAVIGDLSPTIRNQVSVNDAAEAIEMASFVIGQFAGGLYRPISCVTEIYDTRVTMAQGSQIYPALYNGQLLNCSSCATCTCECEGCGITHRTLLRGHPVREVCGVWADGVPLEPNQYVLLDNAVLGFINGAPCDVKCLVVRYYYGTGVPAGGKGAVVKLAEQLLVSRIGGDCKLPQRVTSISRQGLSWTLLDPQDFLKDGRTGIYEIDLLLRAWNPAGALRRARVFNPDIPNGSVTQSAIGEPPFSSNVVTGMSIPSWEPTRAYTNSPEIMKLVMAGTPTYTVFNDTLQIYNPWLTADGVTGILEIPAEITEQLGDQAGYVVYNAASNWPVDRGWIRFV